MTALLARLHRWSGVGVRRCGWCQKFLGLKWMGRGHGGTSHGICRTCLPKWERGEI